MTAAQNGTELRILHVTTDFCLGGIETILLTLAEHPSPELRQEFLMFTDGELRGRLESAGAKVHCLGQVKLKQPFKVLKAQRAFRQVLNRSKFDVVVYHQYPWMPLILDGIAARAGCRSIRWFHNEIDRGYWPESALQKLRPRFPDFSIYCSDFIRRSVNDHREGAVIYTPVSPIPETHLVEWREHVRKEMELSEETVVIIQVSRMGARKGHKQLIESLARLREERNWVCWLVGGAASAEQSRYLDSLRELAEGLSISDRIKFLGRRTDVPRLLAAADVFCQPNIPPPEPFGISLVEALYAGLPVVTSAMGGALEIVDHTCGVLVAPADIHALSEVLQQLVSDVNLRQKLSSGGPVRAKQLCDTATQLSKLQEVFRQVALAPR